MLPRYDDHVGLWANELRAWVPECIFDAHVHVGPPGIHSELSPERAASVLGNLMFLPEEELRSFYSNVYSGKSIVGMIAFGFPFFEIDIDAANAYIVNLMRADSRVKGFVVADPRDASRTIRAFYEAAEAGVCFHGVKPYFDLLGVSNFTLESADFIPEELLRFMDKEGLIMMLHTFGLGMGEQPCQDFVRHVLDRYPGIRIILAHMGRYIVPEQFFRFMDSGIAEHPSVFLEMSFATISEVYERVLERRELWPRLLFASDMPFGAIEGIELCDEVGTLILTREDHVWSEVERTARFAEMRKGLTFNTYHVIKAFKDAVERLGIGGADLDGLRRDVFCGNARRLLGMEGSL